MTDPAQPSRFHLMKPRRWLSRLAHLRAELGIKGLFRKAAGRLSAGHRAYRRRKQLDDAAFDAGGYDTGGTQRLHALTLASDDAAAAGGHHSAIPPTVFEQAIAALDVDIRGFTFVDLGSGKGRAVLLAADQPFDRVIGVEFALELHQLAERNLRVRASRKGEDPRIELIYGDATTFDYPDEPTILFLYNPFDPPILTAVIDQALASWRRSPRPFRVVYVNPVHLDAWTRAGWTVQSAGHGVAIYAPSA